MQASSSCGRSCSMQPSGHVTGAGAVCCLERAHACMCGPIAGATRSSEEPSLLQQQACVCKHAERADGKRDVACACAATYAPTTALSHA